MAPDHQLIHSIEGTVAYRLGAIESNSSKNKIQGLAADALSNRSRTDFSLAPMYLLRISGPFTEMKFRPHSFATALASNVFPHPGYP
jgi:membrane protein required for beta-lactamase induction